MGILQISQYVVYLVLEFAAPQEQQQSAAPVTSRRAFRFIVMTNPPRALLSDQHH